MMQSLKLDYYATARPAWVGMLVLALGVVMALTVAWQVLDKDRQISEGEAKLERFARSVPGRARAETSRKEDAEANVRETGEVNAVIERIGLPWESLFEAIESTPGDDVALLDLKPDVQKGIVRISAEAKSLESQLDYVSALQQNPLFHDVLLQSHQIHDQDPQNPVRFVLQAGWGRAR